MTDAGGFDLSGKPELHTFREDLLRFAVLQLRDRSLAEDVVQDTLVAAMEGMRNFAGQSALKTWIFSILRHKIIDLLRRRGREISFSSLVAEGKVMDDEMDELFAANEHWTHEARPSHWGNPEEILDQQHFWAIFHACLDHLAARTARVFMMRVFLELDIEEICLQVGMTANNCYVIEDVEFHVF